jgi:hypothetical protein
MVPATMCRTATVAFICAVVCPFAVLVPAHVARADTAPRAEAPPSGAQSASSLDGAGGSSTPSDAPPGEAGGGSSLDGSSGDGSTGDPSGGSFPGDPSADGWSSDGCSSGGWWEGGSTDDWLASACASDWSWHDWYGDGGSAGAPPDAQAVGEAPPSDAAPSTDATLSTDALTASVTAPTLTDTLSAPTMSVSGTTVTWTSIAGVSSYVFVRKVPGHAAQYSIVNGTSITPPAVPGATVSYGVRTNVSASTWANEVTVAYPTDPTPSPTPGPVDGTFKMGVVAGSALSYELSFLKALGAHTARIEFGIGTSASSMASVIDAYARAGIRPLLLATFYGRTPTTAEAQSLAGWAAMYGPGGSFWAGKSYPANTAVTDIEFGNETSYSYQFSDNSLSTYAARAQSYALRAKDAASAIAAANPNVGLLVQGDNAVNQSAWVVNMLKAVPDLGQRVAGWTIHPYGPNWASRIDSTINSAAAAGSRALPIWVTEWGISTDNGRCLSDNYGFDKCMSYSTAASVLHTALAGMVSRYGSRLGAFFLYQAHDQAASGTQTGREAYFGAEQSGGSTKGAYTTEAKADLAAN